MLSELLKFGQSAWTTKVVMQTERKWNLHNQPANPPSMNFFEHPKEEISSKEAFFSLFNTFLFLH